MPVQGPSQTFRDGFSMAGMSQVLIVLCIDNYMFIFLFVYVFIPDFRFFECLSFIVRTSWVMTSKARDHMFLIMLLTSPLRYTSRKSRSYNVLEHMSCTLAKCAFGYI
jgi:hypothetical protein